MTNFKTIKAVLENQIPECSLSTAGIAEALKLEKTSEILNAIRFECYEAVERGELVVRTLNSGQEFFQVN
jgi:hypothetical protein